MNAKNIINNIKMKQDLDLQGCADLKKLGDYIDKLESEIVTMKSSGTCKTVAYEKAPWWANPDLPAPKITC